MQNVEKFKLKLQEIRQDLQQITNQLVSMASMENRTDFTINKLLSEYYEVGNKQLHTFDEWNEQNFQIKKGEHALRFWGKPITNKEGKTYCPVQFLFSEDQVMLKAVAATA